MTSPAPPPKEADQTLGASGGVVARRSRRALRLHPLLLAGLVVLLAALLGGGGAYMYYERIVRPNELRRAGPLTLSRLLPSVPPETILPPATGDQNAASYYLVALNEYAHRRVPYLKNRLINPVGQEPPINGQELGLLYEGAKQSRCDLYEKQNGKPRFVFYIEPGHKKWPMRPAVNLLEIRPYIVPLRAVAQAALNWGKVQESHGKKADGERAYQAVARLGCHLMSHPEASNDLELGMELELKATHYLESLYFHEGSEDKLARLRRYQNAVADMQREERHKYAQLDNREAAVEVTLHDAEPLWRVEGAFALVSDQHLDAMSLLEQRTVRHALARARHDPSGYVREAVKFMVEMPDRDFRDPTAQPEEPD